jgi:membrane protein
MTKPAPLTAARRESPWKLGDLTLWHLARDVFREIAANDLPGQAAQLAFYFIFALFPLIFLMVTLFGFFASHSHELQNHLMSFFAELLPPAAFQLLKTVGGQLIANADGGRVTVGIVSALWFASGGVSSMISALNLAYHVRESRSWLKVRAIALGLTLLISILLFVALFIALVSSHFIDWLWRGLSFEPMVIRLWKIFQWPAAFLFVTVSCSAIYYLGPDLKNRRWNWFTPGTAFSASVWLIASVGFRIYLHFFNTYSASYGSLGAVMILLVWLYVAGLAYLVGGAIDAEIARSAMRESQM